jgi:NarL family two-component system response regulator LiaR
MPEPQRGATREAQAGVRRVVVADDHDLYRAAMQGALDSEVDLEVVGAATNGREAVELCRELAPDLALVDVRMPEMTGLEATKEIKAFNPRIGVVIMTMHENLDYLLEAIRAGAAGYLLKDATRREVVETVRRVLDGEPTLEPELADRLFRRLVGERGGATRRVSRNLKMNELEVLRLLARGMSNREIARQLALSSNTVKVHVSNLLDKLEVSDRTQAAVRAASLGLLESEPGR